jgi:hypothetical protein
MPKDVDQLTRPTLQAEGNPAWLAQACNQGGLTLTLALPLLMARVVAHNVHHAPTADDLAILTNPLNAGANLHGDEPYFPGTVL